MNTNPENRSAEGPPSDGDTERQFHSAPGFFPTANVPVWVAMHPDCDEGCLAIAMFVMAFRSNSDGTLPFVKRSTIMNRFTRKKDWLDRRTAVLERIGFLGRIPVYEDAHTGDRTFESYAADGTQNRQTSNDWVIHDQPPAGDAHPLPIQSSEYSKPDKVQERVATRSRMNTAIHNRGAPQRPGSDQEERSFLQGNTQALTSAPN